jgi:hypothetical protein
MRPCNREVSRLNNVQEHNTGIHVPSYKLLYLIYNTSIFYVNFIGIFINFFDVRDSVDCGNKDVYVVNYFFDKIRLFVPAAIIFQCDNLNTSNRLGPYSYEIYAIMLISSVGILSNLNIRVYY